MYVCVCNAVTERDLKNAARRGAVTVAELRDELGVASSCGSCAAFAQEVLNEVHYKRDANNDNLFYAAG